MRDHPTPRPTSEFPARDSVIDTETRILLDGLRQYFSFPEQDAGRVWVCHEVSDRLEAMGLGWNSRSVRVWFNNSRPLLADSVAGSTRLNSGKRGRGKGREMPEQTQRGFYPSENLGMEAVADPGWTDELRAADDPAKLMAVVHLRELADEFLYGGELFPFLAGKLRMKGKLLAGPLAYAMGYTWFREAHRPETDLSAFMDQLEQNEVLAHY